MLPAFLPPPFQDSCYQNRGSPYHLVLHRASFQHPLKFLLQQIFRSLNMFISLSLSLYLEEKEFPKGKETMSLFSSWVRLLNIACPFFCFGKEGRPVVSTECMTCDEEQDSNVCIYLSSATWETWNLHADVLTLFSPQPWVKMLLCQFFHFWACWVPADCSEKTLENGPPSSGHELKWAFNMTRMKRLIKSLASLPLALLPTGLPLWLET